MLTLKPDDLRPYLSAVLLETIEANPNPTSVAENLGLVLTDAGTTLIAKLPYQHAGKGAWVAGFIYKVTRPSSWWPNGADDEIHHLILLLGKGRHLALCGSDAAFRDRVAAQFTALGVAKPHSRAAMSKAFIGPEAKTAWLNGVHTPSIVKADAKVLSGQSLEWAITAQADQSYYLSALRSRPVVAGLTARRRRNKGIAPLATPVIGVAPARARVWLGWPATWDQFAAQAEALLDHLAVARDQAPKAYSDILRKEVTHVGDLGCAYAISLLPKALVDEDADVQPDRARRDLELAYETQFDIWTAGPGNLTANVALAGSDLGQLEVAVDIDIETGEARLATHWSTGVNASQTVKRNRIEAAIKRPEGARIYFDKGFTYADGRIFDVLYDDKPFRWASDDFGAFDIHREKPATAKGQPLVDAIRAGRDNSLFDYVREKWGLKPGWLACDDGAMELADFVHIDPTSGNIELIHVKAAGGGPKKGGSRKNAGRTSATTSPLGISVADYEVVTAQAIKNVRHLDPRILGERLARSAKYQMAGATWKDGALVADRTGLLAALASLPSSGKRRITILQPRLTTREIEYCRDAKNKGKQKTIQFHQLNALMLGADLAARALGADFQSIAACVPPAPPGGAGAS